MTNIAETGPTGAPEEQPPAPETAQDVVDLSTAPKEFGFRALWHLVTRPENLIRAGAGGM